MMLDSLYKITRKEVERASSVLGKAFHNELVMRQVIPDEDERKQKLPLILRFL